MDMMWYRRRGLMVTPHIESVTGAIASFNSDYNKIPIKSLICDIEPIQEGEGDPSPENVRPISGLTGLSVVRTGVNVWDEETDYGYYSSVNGQTGSYTDTQLRSKNYISVKPNTSYCFKKSHSLGDILFYDANKSYISALINVGPNHVFTTPGNCYYIRLNMGAIYGNTYNHDVNINYPSTDTEYHAYKGNTYSVNWETEAGTVYGGSLDVVSGKLVVTHRYWTDNGSKTWVQNPDGSFYTPLGTELPEQIVDSGCCCNYSPYKISFTDYCVFARVNGLMSLGAKWGDFYTDVTALKAAFAETPLQVVYKLATPIEIQLTPQEIKTLLVNNIWCDSGDVSVDYWKWGK